MISVYENLVSADSAGGLQVSKAVGRGHPYDDKDDVMRLGNALSGPRFVPELGESPAVTA